MISPTSAPSLFAPTQAGSANRTSLDKDAFLQLLVAQLKHQDPLSPLQPHEFAAQLAQFSSVEQLTKLNDGISALAEGDHLSMLLGEANFSSSLVGKEVTADGNQLVVTAGTPASVRAEVGGSGGKATLILRDSSGQEVARRDLGSLASGRQTIALPDGLPAGKWTYEVKVEGTDGKDVPVHTYVSGKVEGVSFTDGNVVLRVGGVDVALDALVEIASKTS